MFATRLFTTIAVLVALVVQPTTAFAGTVTRAAGPLVDLQLDSQNPTDGGAARVRVARHDGKTTVAFTVTGLDPTFEGTTLGAHVHVGQCVEGNGAAAGAHYKTGGTASPSTEVWLDFTIRGDGVGSAVTTVPFVIPNGGAGAIVVHALATDHTGAAGTRLACIGVPL
jgi:Cu/Zn superoxide dismutase